MNQRRWMWIAATLVACCWSVLGPGAAPAGEAAAKLERDIDPDAEKVMRRWGDAAKARKDFRFRIEQTVDQMLDTGQKVQYSHIQTVTMSRPDRFRVEMAGDFANLSAWKDEKTFTLLNRDQNKYWQIAAPKSIDDTMKMLLDEYGIPTPLADFLSADPFKSVMQDVTVGAYLGIHHVGEEKCHHMLFVQEEIDWQAWITVGETPRMIKLVITYKKRPGQPQYAARGLDSEALDRPPADMFRFSPPAGAQKTDEPPLALAGAGGESDSK